MTKKLIRSGVGINPENCEVLSTDEATRVAIQQIQNIQYDVDDAESILLSFADMLELMKLVLKNSNIDPDNLFLAAQAVREQRGNFDQKIAIQEQE